MIKWVHKNINLFGGNQNQITIFGQSSGSASVGYQLLHPATKNLVAGAILQSGTPLNSWALQENAREIAFKTASDINSTFHSNNSSKVLEFLLSVDAKTIDKASETPKVIQFVKFSIMK